MPGDYDLTVIVPTFNEEGNIHPMISAIIDVFEHEGIHGEIVVVDDGSTDRTHELVRSHPNYRKNLRLLVRREDHGLSQSILDGFRAAHSPILLTIDADFQHPPEIIPLLFNEIQNGSDIAIASRYVHGGGSEGWPLRRKIISSGAKILSRILFPDITDPGSGFFAIRRSVIDGITFNPIGYRTLMEILGKGRWKKVGEIPYTFASRKHGDSKLNSRIIRHFIIHWFRLLTYGLRYPDSAVRREMKRALAFAFVGALGICVNVGTLFILTEFFHVYYLVSALIAIELSIIHNFLLNDFWTFRGDGCYHISSTFQRFGLYQFVSIGGLLINFGVLYALTEGIRFYYIESDVIGIFSAFLWNYFINRHYTWKEL